MSRQHEREKEPEMTTDNKAWQQRLDDTQKLFSEKDRAIGDYSRALFQHALKDDLVQYSPDEIAGFARTAYKAIEMRKPGKPAVHFSSAKVGERVITTLDIVNDNMPFLIDSIVPELRALGYEIFLLVHPIFVMDRNKDGSLAGEPHLLSTGGDVSGSRESVIHVHFNQTDAAEQRAIKTALASLLKDVTGVVRDWRQMTGRLHEAIRDYKTNPPPLEVRQLAEAVQFLEWLSDDNYTFLGLREYRYDDDAERFVQPVKGSGLGILKDPKVHVLRRGSELVEISPEVREFMLRPEPLIISKANVRSRIHRQVYMDYIGVKLYDAGGKVTGELRLVGLFTSGVYASSIDNIPYVRHKAHAVMERAGFDDNSHLGKALWSVLESYPRDELFQIGFNQLDEFAHAVLALDGRDKVRVLPRWDKFDRYVSVLVYVPRDRYNTETRIRIGDYLADVLDGRVSAFYPGFPEGLLARVHFIIGRNLTPKPEIENRDLDLAIEAIIETWEDGLKDALENAGRGKLIDRYANAFSAAYREAYPPVNAVHDVQTVERFVSDDAIEADVYRRHDMNENRIGLKIFHQVTPIELSARVPMLEHLGFRVINERTYNIEPEENAVCYLHDMTLETASGRAIDPDECKDRLIEAIQAIWQDKADNDGYNALSLNAGLGWRDIAFLRTVSRYLQQIGVTYSQEYMWRALNKNAAITADLVAFFHARFAPGVKARERTQKTVSARIDEALETVSSLDEDQIVRFFRGVIEGTLRTNFFKRGPDGEPIAEVSLKLAPREIKGLPEPRPFREVFMTSPRVEGLHLRFGKVARGGLRWSDRPEDFRTEVLGLVKAQQVKNAVIVPVGSKGGFVPKKLTPSMSRDEFIHEGTEAYKIFIANLLELTDNLDGDTVIHPERVVRHEDDDPYLVVAADKGTATFSDTANGISQSYDFWLDDAFASGGSAGYDHKKMGITARGAWEAVKRHFREMDKDIQTEPFTAAGVGDMSGDVFGNGMLLSKATKLVAAFDHRDIFIDPDPDPATSFKERQRLFDMGRCTWQDYNKELISRGGGIFPRSLKSIPLSAEIQKLVGVKKANMTPFELLRAILKMDVELFWFGGIGTYMRGPLETDADVGDRANDPIRIEAAEIGAKVIGEGANLGMTQRARIAYNKCGGRSNSDAIDNSAGVNSSDVEVNIKIALGAAVRNGGLTIPKRNVLLEQMTEEVAELVLRNNYLQTLAVSVTQLWGMEDFEHQVRMMQDLESRGLLNRQVEDLPNDAQLEEHRAANQPLTRAEIGVVLAYAKITLFDDLIDSDVPDDPYLEQDLIRYFPSDMRKEYADEIDTHKLRREIIATLICNAMINRGGATYLIRLQEQTGASTVDMARAYVLVRRTFGLQDLHARLDALDTKIKGTVQLELYSLARRLMISQSIWALKNVDFSHGIEAALTPLAEGIETLRPKLAGLLPRHLKTTVEKRERGYIKAGVPADIATDFALLFVLDLVPNIISVSNRSNKPLLEGAKVYFDLDAMFLINKLDDMAREVETLDYYDGLALMRGREQLARAQRAMTLDVLSHYSGNNAVEDWYQVEKQAIDAAKKALKDILDSETMSVAKVSVAANILGDLIQNA